MGRKISELYEKLEAELRQPRNGICRLGTGDRSTVNSVSCMKGEYLNKH